MEALPELVDEVAQLVDVAVALAHGGGLAVLEEADELVDDHLQLFPRLGKGEGVRLGRVLLAAQEGGHHGGEAADVAVVVGSQDRDELRRALGPVQLVFVVGHVRRDIGEPSVATAQDAVHVVAELGGPEPQGVVGRLVVGCWLLEGPSLVLGALVLVELLLADRLLDRAALAELELDPVRLLVGDAGALQPLDPVEDDALVVERLLGKPGVEHDAEVGEVAALSLDHKGLAELLDHFQRKVFNALTEGISQGGQDRCR